MDLKNKIEELDYELKKLNAKNLTFKIVNEIIKKIPNYNNKIKIDELEYIVSNDKYTINYKNIFNIIINQNDTSFDNLNFLFTIFFILNNEYTKDGFGKFESLDLMNETIKIDCFKNKIYKIINDLEV